MDRLEMKTKDLTDVNIQKIAELFPSCVTEVKSDDGTTKLVIDFDILKRLLGDTATIDEREREIHFYVARKKRISEAGQ